MKGFKLVFAHKFQSQNSGLTLTFNLEETSIGKETEPTKKSAQSKNYFWSNEEHVHFMMLCNKHGRDWKVICEHICGRSH